MSERPIEGHERQPRLVDKYQIYQEPGITRYTFAAHPDAPQREIGGTYRHEQWGPVRILYPAIWSETSQGWRWPVQFDDGGAGIVNDCDLREQITDPPTCPTCGQEVDDE